MTEAASTIEMQEWFSGLNVKERDRWLEARADGEEIPYGLLATIPPNRREGKDGQWVTLTSASWPNGGEGSDMTYWMAVPFRDFLEQELRLSRGDTPEV